AHSTQKPEALLYRVILSSSNVGDRILDPFFGSGTTGAVAKKLQRHYIGIELSPEYIEIAQERIAAIPQVLCNAAALVTKSKRDAPRISFGQLIESAYMMIGQQVFSKDRTIIATIKADSQLMWQDQSGSIHKIAALIQNRPMFNGWEYWYCEDSHGNLVSIDDLRARYRRENTME
ncbi:MAG: DNA methyltransferase, partial [Chloroflexales bacterium]